ncbi:MAG: 2-dehydro-3-deoxygalactonokinase [Comamonas sp.]
MSPSPAATALIGLDWGTSSLRAFRFDAQGKVGERRHAPHGITQLPAAGPAGFEQALAAIAGDWLEAAPAAPLLACGMVGSAQGWREARYVAVPADPVRVAAELAEVSLGGGGRRLLIVPGLMEAGDLPNVMRGEETQIAGALALRAVGPDGLIGLPGSHSKWARIERGGVAAFDTYMTGEIYAALSQHTLLARTLRRSDDFDAAAFERGLETAQSEAGRRGPLSTVFSVRTLGLTGVLTAEAQADYLSGLLIGHEVGSVCRTLGAQARGQSWSLIGDEPLCRRYRLALAHAGVADVRWIAEATEAGLWAMARAAGLVA